MYVFGTDVRKKYVYQHIPEAEGGFCLDVGAGDGCYKVLVERKGYFYEGVDTLPQSDFIKEGDATNLFLIYYDEKFDLCLAIDLLEHIKDDVKAVSEIRSVLKPGGTAIFHTPNKNSKHIFGEPKDLEQHVRKGYTKEELIELFKGFKEIEIFPTFNFQEAVAWDLFALYHSTDGFTKHVKIEDVCKRIAFFDKNNFEHYGWICVLKK